MEIRIHHSKFTILRSQSNGWRPLAKDSRLFLIDARSVAKPLYLLAFLLAKAPVAEDGTFDHSWCTHPYLWS
jgi:hypothetical protein